MVTVSCCRGQKKTKKRVGAEQHRFYRGRRDEPLHVDGAQITGTTRRKTNFATEAFDLINTVF
jgi:hypothetical protein